MRRALTVKILAVALVLAIVVAAIVWWRGHTGAGRPTAQQMAELQLAVAELENQQYEAAAERLERLATSLPRNRQILRNYAIAALLAAGPEQIDRTREPDRFAAALRRAREAVARLEAVTSDQKLLALLKAKLTQLEGDESAAIAHLRSAAERFPDSITLNAELYIAARRAADPETQSLARQALSRAFRQQPDNLFLLSESLVQQATDRDPRLRETLREAKVVLEPLAAALKQIRRVDLLQLIDEAERAVAEQQWATVARNTRVIANLLRPEVATLIDRRRAAPHLLEYVDVPPALPAASSAAPSEIPVTFIPRAAWMTSVAEPPAPPRKDRQDGTTQPPAAASRTEPVRAGPQVCPADFDLDGVPEIVMAFGRTIRMLKRKTNAEWAELWRRTADSDVLGLVACDLDRDIARPPVGAQAQAAARTPLPEQDSKSKDAELTARAAPGCVDAVPEIVLWTANGVTILHASENAAGAFEPLPGQDDGLRALRGVLEVTPADIDHDGDLDLVVAGRDRTTFWLNREDGTFADVSDRSGPPETLRGLRSVTGVDWDRNVAIDFLAIDADSHLTWLENILHTRFRPRQPIQQNDVAGAVGKPAPVVRDFVVIEADGNPSWDLAVATSEGIELWTTSNPDAGRITPRHVTRIDDFVADGLADLDYDNDSYVDLIAWSSERVLLLRGLPGGRFERSGIDPLGGAAAHGGRGPIHCCVVADVDRDGDDDLLVVRGPHADRTSAADHERGDGAATTSLGVIDLLENDNGNANPWVEIVPRADPDRRPQQPSMRVNVHAIGSLIECRTPRRYQARIVRGQAVRFGLDDDPDVTSIRVLWTNGVPQHVVRPAVRQPVCAQQVLKGSCPYLYTWDGARFVFVTDCLWAAPVGLQAAEGRYVPARNWEYLHIPGEALAARDGRYEIRLTEELWEAAYFDRIRLLVVDHPPGTEILSNEKVGPPDIAGFGIHGIRHRVRPVRAVNHAGRDLLPELVDADDRYARPFDRVVRQGVTERYVIELEFPEVGQNPLRLIMTAWMKPTDTSINIALSQQTRVDPPRPPTLWLRDEQGRWEPAECMLGFPGGKTKTIVCDITDALRAHHRTGPLQLQLRGNMQMCWDQIALSIDENDVPVRLQTARILEADLHYRGFSERIAHPHNGPDRYDYSRSRPEPRWPPMLGYATRYGSVADLLLREDGRCVVLASGDELAVAFAAPEPPPPGWRRDFLLHNVGWDKDADLNTLFGQTIGPMPDRDLSAYAADLPRLLGASNPRIGADHSERRTRTIPRAPFWRMMTPAWRPSRPPSP